MSRTVETRIKIGIESSGAEAAQATISGATRGAKDARQAFEATESATAAMYDSIASGGPEAQRQLETLSESFARLRQEMQGLGDGVRSTIDGILQRLESLDLEGALKIKSEVTNLPAPVAKQVDAVLRQTQAVASEIPDPAPIRQVIAAARDDLPPVLPPEPPRTLLRNAVEAIKEGDVENARRYQTAAARGAIAQDDQKAFAVATEIPTALRQYADKDNGLGSAKRYEETMKRLESHLDELTEPDPTDNDPRTGPTLGGRSALGRAARTLSGVDAVLEGGIRRQSEYDDLGARLGRSRAYLAQAERAGVPDGQLAELQDQLEALTDALEKSRKAYDEAQRRPSNPNSPNPDQPQQPNGFEELFETLAKRIPTGGALGRALPPVAAVAGAWQIGNLADRWLTNQNRDARAEHEAQTDLARQLGIHQDPWTLFRSDRTGMSRDELLELGYTGTDGGRVLAQLDRPASARESRDDATDILRFAHSTGLDESAVTSAVRRIGLAGGYKQGDAQTPLQTLTMALTEGVRNGVSQADTLQSLVSLADQQLAQGRTISPDALAYQASLQAALAKLGPESLKGEAGLREQQSLTNFVTGSGNPAMMALLAPVMQDFSPTQLGLEAGSPEARGLAELEAYSPYAAALEKLELARSGASPEVLEALAAQIDKASGGNPDLYNELMRAAGLGQDARLSILGAGGAAPLIGVAADRTDEFARGRNLDGGAQANNETAKNTAEINATRRDLAIADSYGDLAINDGADLLTTRSQRRKTETQTRIETALGQGDDRGPQSLRDLDRREFGEMRSRTRTWEEDQELRTKYEKANDGATAPMSPIDLAVTRFNDWSSPKRLLEWFRTRGQDAPQLRETAPSQPPQIPDTEKGVVPPLGFEDGLRMLGATATTMRAGERYSGLEGTPAAHLEGKQHRGVDLRIGEQGRPDPIISPWPRAEITGAGYSDSLGNWMSLEAQNGSRWQLGHLEDDMRPRIGDRLERGDWLADEGNTGASTAHHLDLRALDESGSVLSGNTDPGWFRQALTESLNTPREAQKQEVHVTVEHRGLEGISIRGLEGRDTRAVESGFGAATQALGDLFRPPENHRGF